MADIIHAVSVAAYCQGRFLLIRRKHDPARGLFAFPGGKVEPGESAVEAAERELKEETGLHALDLIPAEEVVVEGDGKRKYRLKVFRTSRVRGRLWAGDDADHVGWYTLDEMRLMAVTPSTLAVAERFAAKAAAP